MQPNSQNNTPALNINAAHNSERSTLLHCHAYFRLPRGCHSFSILTYIGPPSLAFFSLDTSRLSIYNLTSTAFQTPFNPNATIKIILSVITIMSSATIEEIFMSLSPAARDKALKQLNDLITAGGREIPKSPTAAESLSNVKRELASPETPSKGGSRKVYYCSD